MDGIGSKIGRTTILAALALFVGLSAASAAQEWPSATIYADQVLPQSAVPVRTAPAVDRIVVAAEDSQREAAGLAPRFAIPNTVSITPRTDGLWESAGADLMIWRLRVASPGAESLNLGFASFRMPEGGRLLIYSADETQVIRPVTARDNAAHGQFWTPILPGRRDRRRGHRAGRVRDDDLLLELTSINVGYRGFDHGSRRTSPVPATSTWSVPRVTAGGTRSPRSA